MRVCVCVLTLIHYQIILRRIKKEEERKMEGKKRTGITKKN